MNQREFEEVIRQPAAIRYEYFILKKQQIMKRYGDYMTKAGQLLKMTWAIHCSHSSLMRSSQKPLRRKNGKAVVQKELNYTTSSKSGFRG